MSNLDWIVLLGTLFGIVGYGVYKTRVNQSLSSYLKGDKSLKWWTIGLSVMATQASAITFLSTPGQAYENGMAFVQNYFGLPIAIIIVCVFFIPIFYKLNVFTAYEYLENRFDLKTRLLGAGLFLIQRGLAAGITIYAPAIILSSVLGWDLKTTILLVGIAVIIYTVSGGTKAVSITQQYQMLVIFFGMFLAFFLLLDGLPEYLSFGEALGVAGKLDKLNAVDFSFDTSKRYTFWSGIAGGLFLSLSYFGTDQSQVQRYIGGSSLKESRLGLIFNALFKIPMQFFILLLGVMLFIFFQFEQPPIVFKQNAANAIYETDGASEMTQIQANFDQTFIEKKKLIESFVVDKTINESDFRGEINRLNNAANEQRTAAKNLISTHNPDFEPKDSDYVFITFILNYLPKGIIGLLLAVILSAAMSSTAGELNALASTTTVDFYKRLINPNGEEKKLVKVSKWMTAFWGVLALCFALFAQMVENLIEAVNILGSLFYGTILGIFLVAFLLKKVKGNAVFIAAVISQLTVLFLYFNLDISYLYYNIIGCALTMALSLVISIFDRNPTTGAAIA